MRFTLCEYEISQTRILYTRMTGKQTDAELRARLDDYAQRLRIARDNGVRSISILDFDESNRYSAEQRRIQADWTAAHEELLRAVELEMIFVLPSPLLRGALTAIFWIAPPQCPYSVCADMNEALARAYTVCARHGITLDADEQQRCRARLHASVHEASRPLASGDE